ncbi:MAG: nuclear transport factor 2 family protein [Clostridia bacterium]|nr:nuclear transport factor 2 family protein [Clostridia bacterium]
MARTTLEVIHQHSENLMSKNIEAVMADFTEDSIMISPQATIKGLAGIRANFEATIKNILTPDVKAEVLLEKAEGNIGYCLWRAEGDRFSIPFATDTFVVENDKIMAQTFAAQVVKK